MYMCTRQAPHSIVCTLESLQEVYKLEIFQVYNRMALCLLSLSSEGRVVNIQESLDEAQKLSLKSGEYAPDRGAKAWTLVMQWCIAFHKAEADSRPRGWIDPATMAELVDSLEKVKRRVIKLRDAGFTVDEQVKSTEALRKDKLGIY